MNEINLIGGFYKSKSLPFSAQDAVNWLPEQVQAQGARSPVKLRGVPGMAAFGSNATDALTITGDAPNCVQNEVYDSYSYTAEGGTPPYTFSLSSGSLPAGLSLSSAGVITGTPTVVETQSFVVLVEDSDSQSDTVSDSIQITAEAENVLILLDQMPTPATTYNMPLPTGAESGDYAVVFGVSQTPTAPDATVATFVPSASYNSTTFGTAYGTGGAFSFAWSKELTSGDISTGVPLVLSSGSTAQTGNFIIYVIKNSALYSPSEANDAANNSTNSGDVTTSGLLASAIFGFSGYEAITPRVATGYTLTEGQRSISANINVYACYQYYSTKPSPYNAGTWTASGSLFTQSSVSVAVGAL